MNDMPVVVRDAIAACRSHFIYALGFSALVNILYLAPTLYMMQVYDRVVPTGGKVTLLALTLVLALAIATLAMLEAVRSRLMVRASLRLDRLLAGAILERLIARGQGGRGDPSTAQAMRDFDTVRQVITAPTLIGFLDAPWTPIYVLAAFLIHPILGLFILAAGAMLVGLTLISDRATRGPNRAAHKATAEAYVMQEEAAQHAETIRALGMGRALVDRQLDGRAGGMTAHAQAQMASSRFAAIAKFARLFLQSLALGVAAWLAINQMITVGSIIAASVLLSRALQPIELLVGGWSNLQQANEGLRSLKTVLADDKSAVPLTALPAPDGAIAANRIALRSPDGQSMLLKGVSFELAAGQMMGIIGSSGAGKTTLIRVLAGCLAPEGGQVLIDRADAAMWDHDRLARFIGYLPQEPGFLIGTVAQNIARFSTGDSATGETIDARVIAAAKAAGCHDLILGLPGGYDTPIGRTGIALSAGQRQRIALARALFDAPPILIFDEPNAALDAEGEAALMRAIGLARQRGATILIAAHRTNVLAGADRLLVLNGGAVDLEGPRVEVADILAKRVSEARSNVVGLKGAVA